MEGCTLLFTQQVHMSSIIPEPIQIMQFVLSDGMMINIFHALRAKAHGFARTAGETGDTMDFSMFHIMTDPVHR